MHCAPFLHGIPSRTPKVPAHPTPPTRLQVSKVADLGGVVLQRERLVVVGRHAVPVVSHLDQLASVLLEPHLMSRRAGRRQRRRGLCRGIEAWKQRV